MDLTLPLIQPWLVFTYAHLLTGQCCSMMLNWLVVQKSMRKSIRLSPGMVEPCWTHKHTVGASDPPGFQWFFQRTVQFHCSQQFPPAIILKPPPTKELPGNPWLNSGNQPNHWWKPPRGNFHPVAVGRPRHRNIGGSQHGTVVQDLAQLAHRGTSEFGFLWESRMVKGWLCWMCASLGPGLVAPAELTQLLSMANPWGHPGSVKDFWLITSGGRINKVQWSWVERTIFLDGWSVKGWD